MHNCYIQDKQSKHLINKALVLYNTSSLIPLFFLHALKRATNDQLQGQAALRSGHDMGIKGVSMRELIR